MSDIYVDVEEVFDPAMAKRRGRQGWKLLTTHYNPATNAKQDNGFVVYIMVRTEKDKDAAASKRQAKMAERKKNRGKKTTKKKTTAKKGGRKKG